MLDEVTPKSLWRRSGWRSSRLRAPIRPRQLIVPQRRASANRSFTEGPAFQAV